MSLGMAFWLEHRGVHRNDGYVLIYETNQFRSGYVSACFGHSHMTSRVVKLLGCMWCASPFCSRFLVFDIVIVISNELFQSHGPWPHVGIAWLAGRHVGPEECKIFDASFGLLTKESGSWICCWQWWFHTLFLYTIRGSINDGFIYNDGYSDGFI